MAIGCWLLGVKNSMLKSFFSDPLTFLKLGFVSILQVLLYRCKLKVGYYRRDAKKWEESGIFFRKPKVTKERVLIRNTGWDQAVVLFGRHFDLEQDIPDWHFNMVTKSQFNSQQTPWCDISDFDKTRGDIKSFWELSRFEWVIPFSQRPEYVERLNCWLKDWCQHNFPYNGVNWKCGQEASIRVLRLATAAIILDQVSTPEPALIELVKVHLERIAMTVDYALAQNNNHGVSEGAALYIGGSWLESQGDSKGADWCRVGKKILENRAKKLLAADGSFSQYSVVYHRLVLDTYALAECWRMHLNLLCFSEKLYRKLCVAVNWLYQLTDLTYGDAPNVGANDGTNLLPLTDASYRDFRPSIQLSMALFAKCRFEKETECSKAHLDWLGVCSPKKTCTPQESFIFDKGGFAGVRKEHSFLLFRFPRFHFRPGQADALHLDYWVNSKNVLMDAGTYSYNAQSSLYEYFNGTKSHNTVQFDDRDQMPLLSRFLFGHWLSSHFSMKDINGVTRLEAEYRDYKHAFHHRVADLHETKLVVTDTVSGFAKKAVLRWRLPEGNWSVSGTKCFSEVGEIQITSSNLISRCEIVQGWCSLFYLERKKIFVLEVELVSAGSITSEIVF